ncbi:glycosyltransferase [Isoptericola sp. b441]|uniref:Glycosyltransferase n=1 Tax=Actinotalea lenta TaxID=3064654 RepID=A0ABT9D7M2_9CELL|nr:MULTISPECIES: glycosyltransferase [unclassified Isoptericola]MDO8106555.1 glycosyltransferase [Isoptericola sp. b441]MDO8121737.1 glycosyltransferase [Isoptericola sp. b490]
MEVTVVVPSFNEAGNVRPLVAALGSALSSVDVDVLYVDDSTDDTPDVVRRTAPDAPLPLAVHHRDRAVGGLSGAVVEGLRRARGSVVVVMDGDLQHPPDVIPALLDLIEGGVDIAVASRYTHDGDAGGLSSALRRAVSSAATSLSRAALPRALADCSDPMTGFFAVRADRLNLERLDPSGFKILLEILATHDLAVGEVPFTFGRRHAGVSKATMRQGVLFLRQLLALRRLARRGVPTRVGA